MRCTQGSTQPALGVQLSSAQALKQGLLLPHRPPHLSSKQVPEWTEKESELDLNSVCKRKGSRP